MRGVLELVEKLSATSATTVLIQGESGTGKDAVARAIHYASDRAGGPFSTIACTAVPEHLLESELFGRERGAYTDARSTKKGLIELASSGTIFLDEIGDMGLGAQGKLLRFLEEHTIRRVGGTADIRVDARIIAATHRDLTEAVRQRQFREDLFYRINVVPIHIPALRDYAWPGNVRELRNVVERVMILEFKEWIDLEDLPAEIRSRQGMGRSLAAGHVRLPPEGTVLEEVEQALVRQALERTRGNRTHAARLLGISRDALRYKIKKFGLAGAEQSDPPA